MMVLVWVFTTHALVATESAAAPVELHGRLVVGGAVIPAFEGAQRLQPFPFVGGRLQLGRRYLQVDGLSARINVLGAESLEIGPYVNATQGRSGAARNAQVAALPSIALAVEVGGFVANTWSAVGFRDTTLRLSTYVTRDVSGVHDGWQAALIAYYAWNIGERWIVGTEWSTTFASREYLATYFAVGPDAAAASGLPTFQPRAGVKDVGVTLNGGYALGGAFWLVATAGDRWLIGDAGASPITARAGRVHQFVSFLGVSYNF